MNVTIVIREARGIPKCYRFSPWSRIRQGRGPGLCMSEMRNLRMTTGRLQALSRGTSRTLALSVVLGVMCGAALQGQQKEPQPFEVATVKAGRYSMQSNAWVNLHQRLVHESRFKTAPPVAIEGEKLASWRQAVADYGRFLGNRSPIFNHDLAGLNLTLSETDSENLPDSIPPGAARVLRSAMSLYQEAQWEADDRANRFWMQVARALIEAAGEELAAAHERVYGVPFPTRIRVDVSPFAWQFGAYTVGEGDFAHVVISSTDPGYRSFAALEMLMHEPSHAIVGARNAAVGTELTRISAELGVSTPPNLWHAILFYTSGELTRRALARRGVDDYQPVILGMYRRGFADYREALETHWQGWIDGKIGRDEAIRRMLVATAGKPEESEQRPVARPAPERKSQAKD